MISVIIPTYNRLLTLKKCIESLVEQYYEGLEIIVIDDFSTDFTSEYLHKLVSNNFYIKALFNERNLGVNYSRNRGIQIAQRNFILFLDSDDKLISGSLTAMLDAVTNNKDISHFLFLVSYRCEEFKGYENRRVFYEDWLSGKIQGDFTHLVKRSVMQRFLFFEQFRMFEYLNWLRIKRETSPQLLLPIATTEVDRNREDSLSRASKLDNVSSIRNKFESQYLYYTLYHKDLKKVKSPALTTKLVYCVILGTAVDEKVKARELIAFGRFFLLKLLGKFILYCPSPLLLKGVISYSIFKTQVLNCIHS